MLFPALSQAQTGLEFGKTYNVAIQTAGGNGDYIESLSLRPGLSTFTVHA